MEDQLFRHKAVVILTDVLKCGDILHVPRQAYFQESIGLYCPLCNIAVGHSKHEISQHMTAKHGSTCCYCGKDYANRKGYRLYKHILKHIQAGDRLKHRPSNEEIYVQEKKKCNLTFYNCKTCDQVFLNAEQLERHKDDIHGQLTSRSILPEANSASNACANRHHTSTADDEITVETPDDIEIVLESPPAAVSTCTLPLPSSWNDDGGDAGSSSQLVTASKKSVDLAISEITPQSKSENTVTDSFKHSANAATDLLKKAENPMEMSGRPFELIEGDFQQNNAKQRAHDNLNPLKRPLSSLNPISDHKAKYSKPFRQIPPNVCIANPLLRSILDKPSESQTVGSLHSSTSLVPKPGLNSTIESEALKQTVYSDRGVQIDISQPKQWKHTESIPHFTSQITNSIHRSPPSYEQWSAGYQNKNTGYMTPSSLAYDSAETVCSSSSNSGTALVASDISSSGDRGSRYSLAWATETAGTTGRIFSAVGTDAVRCALCQKQIPKDKFALRTHFVVEHKNFILMRLQRKKHKKTSPSLLPYQNAIQSQANHISLTCPKCSFSTTNAEMLSQHINSSHFYGLHYCGECDYSCLFEDELNAHTLSFHTKQICMHCQYSTTSNTALATHIRLYHT